MDVKKANDKFINLRAITKTKIDNFENYLSLGTGLSHKKREMDSIEFFVFDKRYIIEVTYYAFHNKVLFQTSQIIIDTQEYNKFNKILIPEFDILYIHPDAWIFRQGKRPIDDFNKDYSTILLNHYVENSIPDF
ncbi:MAG: hypothetical protein KBA99_11330 [Bacteroidia bacterium]|nr:hypothetical protein [Bacteroidota bacterium]MBP7245880.1 hypothetical protein [Bacteroidia bacterium]